MYKVTVTAPATSTNLGPGLEVLGLALSLQATVELQVRPDDHLAIHVQGEGRDALPANLTNPVLKAAARVFQQVETAPAGLQLSILNPIPWNAGLGAHAALIVGGIIAANNLVDANLSADQIIQLAVELGANKQSVTTILRGGLGICSQAPNGALIHRTVDVVPLRVVVVLPTLPNYSPAAHNPPGVVPIRDAIHNIGQTALAIEALRTGDLKLLRQTMLDRLHEPYRSQSIPGYSEVATAAYEVGALAVVLSGAGPALLAFAEAYHAQVADAMVQAFAAAGVEAQHWILGVDRQGVVISVVE